MKTIFINRWVIFKLTIYSFRVAAGKAAAENTAVEEAEAEKAAEKSDAVEANTENNPVVMALVAQACLFKAYLHFLLMMNIIMQNAK